MEISEKDIEYLKYMERTDLFYRAMPKDITDEKKSYLWPAGTVWQKTVYCKLRKLEKAGSDTLRQSGRGNGYILRRVRH